MINKNEKKLNRKKKIRLKIASVKKHPRLVVFRSNKHIYAQIIDYKNGNILASVNDLQIKSKDKKIDIAFEVGKIIAEKAKNIKINKIVFDRGGYKYHGKVKVLADSARKHGLLF